MNYQRAERAYQGQSTDMYDDEPRIEDYRQIFSRKDYRRSPPRESVGERHYYSAHTDRKRWDGRDDGHSRRNERSKSPQREGRGRYTDRDREDYQSPRRERSRSRSPYYGAPPNRNVILEGIPTDLTQEDLLHELQHNLRLDGLEEVRVIKDKRTGLSRGFAFAQFTSIGEAKRFLQEHFPTLALHGPNSDTTSEPTKVRIAFSREREDRAGKSDDDWKCDVCFIPNFAYRTLCFRCNAPRSRSTAQGVVVAQGNVSGFSGFATTGDSDVSPDGAASQFLLLRGLEPGVNEEILAKGIAKLIKTKASTPEAPASKKSKVASTTNDASLGAREGSLCRVLLVRDRKSNDSWRYGFGEFGSVEDAQAAMLKYKSMDKFTIASKPVMVSYIHAGVFVPVIQQINDDYAKFTFSPLFNTAVKLMYWDEAAYASELLVVTPDQPAITKSKESEQAKLAAAAAQEGLVSVGRNGESKPKKRKLEQKEANKVVAPHLQFWTSRHAEIHGLPAQPTDDNISEAQPQPAEELPPSQSFADLKRKCCLLCSRQFKSEAEVNKHERISQLHRDNMKNSDLVSKALLKLKKSVDTKSDNSAYRDRAKERRQAFSQPKQPAVQHNRLVTEPASSTKEDVDEPVKSKGAALLSKMGWSAGEGLGAQGTGRTEAITTELYAQGVGLGAQGSRIGDAADEAQRQTKGNYADFLNKTRDKAKERFDSMG